MSIESEFTLNELNQIVTANFSESDLDGASIERLGQLLPYRVHPHTLFASPPTYWDDLKQEFRLLICTKDRKYSQLRKALAKNADKSQMLLVSTIAAAMGHSLGIAAGILTPFCALCLIAVLSMGREAFCKTSRLSIPVS